MTLAIEITLIGAILLGGLSPLWHAWEGYRWRDELPGVGESLLICLLATVLLSITGVMIVGAFYGLLTAFLVIVGWFT